MANKRLFVGQPVQAAFGGGKLARRDYLPTPPVVPDLAWYDPSYDGGVLAGNGLVLALADLSSAGNPLYPVTIATAPAIGAINGRLAMGFSGSKQMQSSASRSSLTSSSFAVVLTNTVAAGARTVLGANNDGGNQFRLNGATLETSRQGVAVKASQGNASVSASTPTVVGQVIDASGVTQYINTTSETDADANAFTASRTLNVGRRNTNQEGWDGAIGEIMMFASTLSGSDALLVVGYLMKKWGLV